MKMLQRLMLAATLVAVAWGGSAHAQVNTQYGQQAGASEQNNAYITDIGYQAMFACTYCYGTTAIGADALRVSSGYYNTGVGFASMIDGTSGSYNTAIGTGSLSELGSGSQNVAVGYNAGSCATVNGSNNIWVSHCGLAKDNGVIRIGTQGVQRFTQIAGIYNIKLPAGGGQALYVNSKGQIGILSTKIITAAAQAPLATQADVLALRQEIASLHNEVYALKAQAAKGGR